jgi:uncharacterized alkaline shock family protein YloU
MDDVTLAQVIANTTLGVPGVVGISSGVGYTEATYGPHTAVLGVGITAESNQTTVNVHIVAAETPLPRLAERIRAAVRTAVGTAGVTEPRIITVFVDDIEMKGTTSMTHEWR